MNHLSRQTTASSFWRLGYLGLFLLSGASPAQAQVVSDGLMSSPTVVLPNGNIYLIGGGTAVGGNLFHSFSEFSVPAGNTAFFNTDSTPNVQTIISRVTGGTISRIDGTIATTSTANLFLLNPNGIIFGANAQLSIGGSFIASTASSLKFADGSEFSATNPQEPPMLTINVPIGLQFGSNPGAIINQSQATSSFPLPPPLDPSTPVGLQVLPGRTLALIGGDLSLNSGNVTALQGNIFLGSVASPGFVGFIPTSDGLTLDYTGVENFGNIELSGIASVNASGLGGGAIQVRGGQVTLRDRSTLLSDTIGNLDGRGIDIQATQFKLQDGAFVSSSTIGTGTSGNLAIRATDSVELSGLGFDHFIERFVEPALNRTATLSDLESGLFTGTATSTGRAGTITIDTQNLSLRDGAIILSPTFGTGDGGNVAIRASQSVDISGSGLLTTAFDQGNAGKLEIDTGRLTIREQAVVSTVTLGAGKGGNLRVRASDSVVMSEFQETSPLGTSLSTSTVGGTGDSGNLEIDTRSLLLEGGATITSSSGATTDRIIPFGGRGGNITIRASDSVTVRGTSNASNPSRSQIATATLGSSDAGDLRIDTKQLIIQEGGGVGASTVNAGRGGDVFINASESVEISGMTKNGVSPSAIATASGDPLVSFFYPGQTNPTGAAGDIEITTEKLTVQDGASVNVESFGTGDAGAIKVVADAIALDNGGTIDASTASGAGGDINLEALTIVLRHGSAIRTNAENTQGGNITIDTDTLVAVPEENSDITANAQKGPGGRVKVTAQGIFGTQFRDRLTPESDITATSELGPEFNGTVQIDIRAIDPSRGLTELPETVVDPSRLIATGCPANQGSSFAMTGRGGLPEDPTGTLRGQTVWQDLRLVSQPNATGEQRTIPQSPARA
ncbi:MAG TPA: S-layer family protein, partial [Coleofasciculaceae cyanobacterium]